MVGRTTLKPRMCDCVYLCVLELTLLASKLSLALQLVSELELKISGRVKDHKDENKRNFY